MLFKPESNFNRYSRSYRKRGLFQIGNARYFRREICSVEVLASSSPFTGTPNLSRSKLRLGCCWKIKGFSRGGTSAPHRVVSGVDGYCGDCQRLKLGCWLVLVGG
ncbi:hypothetical protein OIU76_007538 [Salix suchowensis]|nr:hypothetical protein OIU76_007538 [Salix suchowensis]